MGTPPISESAELTQWSLYINHYPEVRVHNFRLVRRLLLAGVPIFTSE
jgi:hypothetical protein